MPIKTRRIKGNPKRPKADGIACLGITVYNDREEENQKKIPVVLLLRIENL